MIVMKVAIILGTRPEIIKASPVIREFEKRGIDFFILHTGQHYSYEMDKLFFEELKLPLPKYNLESGKQEFGKQIGIMVTGIQEILKKEKPDCVAVFGDTNSVLAGALAASKLNIKIAHIEAGLRSHDVRMLEETNRIITDNISNFLFTPTEETRKNLYDEKLDNGNVYVVGNTVVDAVYHNITIANNDNAILTKLNLKEKTYIILTTHRPENVDFKSRLEDIYKGINMIYEKFKIPIIFPMHPRTKKMTENFNIKLPDFINVIDPLGYLDFLYLIKNSRLLITDSGGLQEESCTLGIPCVTVRDNTERPETLDVGSNILAGTNPENILNSADKMLNKDNNWNNPYGDGNTARRVVDILIENIDMV